MSVHPFDMLTKHEVETCDKEIAYDGAEIRSHFGRVEDVGGEDLLVVSVDDNRVDYAFFSFHLREENGRTFYRCLFQGFGYGGKKESLREMRHTWFAPDDGCGPGYVFYLPLDATIKAFTILKEYFD